MKAFLAAVLISAATLPAAEPVDVLIIAPHPDDEVIGCTGVILQALEQKKKVAVVVMTNGDGFPKGTAAITGKPRAELKPEDFFQLARLRQKQSYEGIRLVGLKKRDVAFLSYPDGGLAAIYHSDSGVTYRNKHTGKAETYGLIGQDYHSARHGKPASYTKASILGDLAEIIRERSPSEIYVTHELDQHSDHRAAMWFVRDAAGQVGFRGQLFTFIVHGKKLPEGSVRRVQLSPNQLAVKKAAIGVHKIPKVHDHLVDTHAKEAELFWPIKVLP